MTDWEEWKARTDPLDPNSFMSIGNLTPLPTGELELYLHTIAGRSYAIDISTNLLSQSFVPWIEGIQADKDSVIILITNELQNSFFFQMRLDP